MATLFPNDQAIKWEGDDETSDAKNKRLAITSYMTNKLRLGGFRNEVQKMLLAWIDDGNAFARVSFENTFYTNDLGEQVTTFVGPRVTKVPLQDIVFDPSAASFEQSPKIIRSLRLLGSLVNEAESNPDMPYLKKAVENSRNIRARVTAAVSQGDVFKNTGYQMDGYSSWFD